MSTRHSASQARKRKAKQPQLQDADLASQVAKQVNKTDASSDRPPAVAAESRSRLAPPTSAPLEVQEFHGEHAVSYRYSLSLTAQLSHVVCPEDDAEQSSWASWSMPSLTLSRWWQSLVALACSLFLPLGYPASVTPDYLEVRTHTAFAELVSRRSCSLLDAWSACIPLSAVSSVGYNPSHV
jgi:hypothetical protein